MSVSGAAGERKISAPQYESFPELLLLPVVGQLASKPQSDKVDGEQEACRANSSPRGASRSSVS